MEVMIQYNNKKENIVGSNFPQWVLFDGRSEEKDENLERRNLVNCEGEKKLVKVLEEGGTCF
jgi:hypothetical protein